MREEKLLSYIKENFNVDYTFIRLVSSIKDYLKNENCSLEGYHYDDKKNGTLCYYKIYSYIFTLVDMLNISDIDITIDELIENDIIINYN